MSSEIVYCGGGRVDGDAEGAGDGCDDEINGALGWNGGGEIGVGASEIEGRIGAGSAIWIETAPVGSADPPLDATTEDEAVADGIGAMPMNGMAGSISLAPTLAGEVAAGIGEVPSPPGGSGLQSIRSEPAGTTTGASIGAN